MPSASLRSGWSRLAKKYAEALPGSPAGCCPVASHRHGPIDRRGFRDIPGFPGYLVNDQGVVLSARWGCPMRPATLVKGYKQLSLVDARGRPRSVYVHRLVLLAFQGFPPEGHQARHLNGNPSDNRLSNLAWGTVSENAADRLRHGRLRECRLSPERIEQAHWAIREMDRLGLSMASACRLGRVCHKRLRREMAKLGVER